MTDEEAIEMLKKNKQQRGECFISVALDKAIQALEQKSKTGHWIEEINDYGELEHWHCDKCYEDSGFITTCKWDYCPNCGAEMKGEEE